MKVDLILKEFEQADGSKNVVVFLTTPGGIDCPIRRLGTNDKLMFKLKCEIKESEK